MAFVIEQLFNNVQHHYDPQGDVLYISFGPPVPAITIDVEDWFAIRLAPSPPWLCGFTLVGFKRLFSKIRPDLIKELPERVARINKGRFILNYSDELDALIIRFEEDQPAYYEEFENYIYLEKSLISGEIIGFKITHYTDQGTHAIEALLAAMLDAMFAPVDSPPGPADKLTRAFFEHLNLPNLLSLTT
ncbi:MAG: hypothetical protein HY089_01670 [Ignavibacteriales bacterium]|nr:hypothetical protein [Ignavibacteriales bacterium]